MLVVTMTDGTRYATRTLPGDTGKPDAFAQGPAWTDTTTPRTDAPVRFAWHFDAHNGGKAKAWTEPYSWQV